MCVAWVLGWILHLAEQQVFAGRNSDTWMRTVRLLIRDSTSPLSPHLGRRGDAQRHTLTVTLTRVHSQIRMHSRWPLISRTNESRQSQMRFSPKAFRPEVKSAEAFVHLKSLVLLFSCRVWSCLSMLRHHNTSVDTCDRQED